MPNLFIPTAPNVEDCWRGIILFGRNSASFKFALAKALLDLKPESGQLVRLEDIASVYASHICEHLALSDKQGTSRSSKFLDGCRKYNSGEIKKVREWLEEIGSWQKENGEPRLFQHFPKQMNLATCPRVISGLYVAALTIYGKCFTSAKGRRVKLEKRIFDDHKSNPAQFLSSHEHIMHLRHNLAAHSGTTSLEGTEVVFTLAPKSKRKVWPKVFAISMQVQAIVSSGMETSDDDPSFSKLVEYVDSWVNYKTNLLKKRIWVEEVEKNVREEYGADPDMLARVKMVEAEWEMPDP